MDISSHLIQRMLGLPPPATRDLVIERDLRVPMADGAVLLADRWAPRAGGEALPAALLRTPYGRRGPFGVGMARPLAERGFQVLIQSTRGTFGSGGVFDPMRCERDDGLATLQWLVKHSPGSAGRSSCAAPATWAMCNGRWPMTCRPRSR